MGFFGRKSKLPADSGKQSGSQKAREWGDEEEWDDEESWEEEGEGGKGRTDFSFCSRASLRLRCLRVT